MRPRKNQINPLTVKEAARVQCVINQAGLLDLTTSLVIPAGCSLRCTWENTNWVEFANRRRNHTPRLHKVTCSLIKQQTNLREKSLSGQWHSLSAFTCRHPKNLWADWLCWWEFFLRKQARMGEVICALRGPP